MLLFLFILSQVKTPEQRLIELREKLKEEREKIASLEKEEKSILYTIKKLDDEISLTRELLQELRKEEKRITGEIEETENYIKKLEEKLERKREILKKRLREMYKHGKLHPLEIVLLSHSFNDAIKRIKYLSLIAEQDMRVYRQAKALIDRLKLQRELLDGKLAYLREIKEEVEKEEQNLKKRKKEKEDFLAGVTKEKKKTKKLIEELKQAEKDLEKLILALEKERRKKAKGKEYFEKFRGKIPWPCKGKVISGFGLKYHPKYGTATRNNGIDIKADWGEDVYAVGDGKVVYADNFLGYGKVILLDHGDGFYTLYAHLSSMSVGVGDEVKQGEIIGKVGDTGSVDEPMLHFEIRKGGKPVDPMLYLKK
ncbi:hypothetical protein DRQ20_03845 [bacterium]|nr:MAG: hypothetical protein DRQ18_02670 [bacterium]RKZ26045.1 MAG: hypothetical protein DRQ20_03845 [bacterium]